MKSRPANRLTGDPTIDRDAFPVPYFITFGIYILSAAASSVASGAPSSITPYIGQPGAWDCRSVVIDQTNALGLAVMPRDLQTVNARVFFRQKNGSGSLSLRLMRQDAEVLRGEVGALMKRKRPTPIRFQTRVTSAGECEVYQISG